MNPKWQAAVFIAAVILSVLAALRWTPERVHLGWLGAACFITVFAWNAAEVAW